MATYLRLMKFLKPHWHWMALTLLLSTLTAFTSVLPHQVIGVAVNRIAHPPAAEVAEPPADTDQTVSQPTGETEEQHKRRSMIPITPLLERGIERVTHRFPSMDPIVAAFLTYGACFLLLYLLSEGMHIGQGLCMAYVGQSVVRRLRDKAYTHLQGLSLRYFEDRQTGDIMSRVVNDVGSLEAVIVGPVVELLTNISRLSFLLYFCLRWDWGLTLLALAVTPLLVTTTWAFGRLLRKNFRQLRKRLGELNGRLQDNISGVRIIKSFGAEQREAESFSSLNHACYAIQLRLARMFTAFRPMVGMLNHIGSLIVLCVGGMKVARGELEIGVFILFFEYLRMMYGPINSLTRFYHHIQRALASGERVFELLDEVPTVEEATNPTELQTLQGAVTLQDVSFSYSPEAPPALQNITLDIKPGEMVALVGPSGSGKTTLAALLLRFYDPESGRIALDGHDLREISFESLRRHVSVVLQDPFLFNDTVRSNIAYGAPSASTEELEQAAHMAGATEFIDELTSGYETVVGERGVKLSGGQRQRLSIARAILADPRILILDEATSSVDNHTEKMIQDAIFRMAGSRTMVVIAHRLSTIEHADRICVLNRGELVQQGTHPELLADEDGLYSKLWKRGFRENSA